MLEYLCQHCQSRLNVQDDWLGKAVRCPRCHQVGIVSPSAAPSPVSVAAVPEPDQMPGGMPVISVKSSHRPGVRIQVGAEFGSAPAAVEVAASSPATPVVVSAAQRPAAKSGMRRRESKRPVALLAVGGALALLSAGLALYWVANSSKPASPTWSLQPIAAQDVRENASLTVLPQVTGLPSGLKATFSLDQAPSDAAISAETGKITWTPGEKDGPKEHAFVIRAACGSASATQRFVVRVAEESQLPHLPALRELSAQPGEEVALRVVGDDPDLPKAPLRYSLLEAPPGASIDEKTGQFHWTPGESAAGKTVSMSVVASKEGTQLSANTKLTIRVGAAPTTVAAASAPLTPAPTPQPATVPAPITPTAPVRTELDDLVALYEETLPKNKLQRQLFAPANYKKLRSWFGQQFLRDQEANLRKAWGADFETMSAWLDEHPELKEELFTAIRPEQDDVVAAMQILAQLKEAFPDEVERYGNLTIATCVVWDKRNGIYDYQGHADRAKASMPSEPADAVANFRYLVEREKFMEGRILYVPWEYLTLVVNHATPLQERDWALTNYGPRRAMFGKCYHDCPYDDLMLKTESAQARLNGKAYNFVTLRQFGGVCAHQADYSSRIGKSIGVPAAYVSGDGRFAGAGHAWVMWVELVAVTPNSIKFSLESHGRYRNDHYYVGHLEDPQTGLRISDRDLERRLHAVGANTQGRRHAELVMRAWPLIRGKRELEFSDEVDYLSQTLGLSPWNEQAWRQLAATAKDAELSVVDRKNLQKAFLMLFTAFAQLPDLTTEVFGDLLVFETKTKKRIEYYFQLLEMYAAGKRPDLSFQALPQLIQILVAENRQTDAVAALSAAIRKNANEGQYVPAALDRLDALCAGDEKLQASLLAFYGELLPLISTNRGGEVSDYCVQMHERAIQKFEAAGQAAPAQVLRARVQAIQAAGK